MKSAPLPLASNRACSRFVDLLRKGIGRKDSVPSMKKALVVKELDNLVRRELHEYVTSGCRNIRVAKATVVQEGDDRCQSH